MHYCKHAGYIIPAFVLICCGYFSKNFPHRLRDCQTSEREQLVGKRIINFRLCKTGKPLEFHMWMWKMWLSINMLCRWKQRSCNATATDHHIMQGLCTLGSFSLISNRFYPTATLSMLWHFISFLHLIFSKQHLVWSTVITPSLSRPAYLQWCVGVSPGKIPTATVVPVSLSLPRFLPLSGGMLAKGMAGKAQKCHHRCV